MRLIADIGGTNARFAWSKTPGEYCKLTRFPVDNFTTFDAALSAFLSIEAPPDAVNEAAVAAAGPLEGGEIRLTNSPWNVRLDDLSNRLGIQRVALLNDFVAVGHAVPHLADSDLILIGSRIPNRDAEDTLLAIGPGTGLGLCLIIPNGRGGWLVSPTEAGHARLAPASQSQWDLFQRLPELDVPPCADDVLSGPGLARICQGLGGLPLEPEAIYDAARRGDPLARNTVLVWLKCLARFAGDAALMTGAFGGVLFAGAIVRELHGLVEDKTFREAFEGTSRMTGKLSRTPTAVILRGEPGLLGLTHIEIPAT